MFTALILYLLSTCVSGGRFSFPPLLYSAELIDDLSKAALGVLLGQGELMNCKCWFCKDVSKALQVVWTLGHHCSFSQKEEKEEGGEEASAAKINVAEDDSHSKNRGLKLSQGLGQQSPHLVLESCSSAPKFPSRDNSSGLLQCQPSKELIGAGKSCCLAGLAQGEPGCAWVVPGDSHLRPALGSQRARGFLHH